MTYDPEREKLERKIQRTAGAIVGLVSLCTQMQRAIHQHSHGPAGGSYEECSACRPISDQLDRIYNALG